QLAHERVLMTTGVLDEVLDLPQDALRARDDLVAEGRQNHPPLGALHERRAELCLELVNSGAEGGLAHRAWHRRATAMDRSGENAKIPEMARVGEVIHRFCRFIRQK